MFGHIVPMDGWLCTTQCPYDVSNPSNYFNGHYQTHGLNMQAMCDANLCIIYIRVFGPGKMNDTRAYMRLIVLQIGMATLENGYFCSGDNTYTLSNAMLIPYIGTQRDAEYHMECTFYLSQLQIRIEICFGRLTPKWKIFRRKLDCLTTTKIH